MKQGWEIKKLGEVCDILNGYAFKSEKYASDGVRVLRITNVQKGYVVDDDPKFYPKDEMANLQQYVLKENDLLMSLTGNVGRVGLLQNEMLPAALNQRVACLRIKNEQLYINYLFHFLNSDKFENDAIFSASGIAQKNMSTEWLKKYTIPVPSREEQERIVAELDCLSGVIEKKREQLKQLDALAQSIFYQMFGDPITNEKGWETSQFDNACELITDFVAAGSFADIKHNVKYIDRPDFAQLIRTTDIKNQFTKSDYVYVSESAFNYLWRVKLDKVSIILPNVGVNCGEVYYITPTMLPYKNNVLGPNAILVRSNKENNRYLSFLFKTSYFQYQLRTIVNAVGQPKFNKTELKQLSVILPPLTLQQEFADKIEAIEKQKELIKKSISETETLFNARMDYYFN